jgi:hypothetical protein
MPVLPLLERLAAHAWKVPLRWKKFPSVALMLQSARPEQVIT